MIEKTELEKVDLANDLLVVLKSVSTQDQIDILQLALDSMLAKKRLNDRRANARRKKANKTAVTTLSNAAIKGYCGGKAAEIIQIVGEMADAYDAKRGTIGGDYDEDGREDVRKLLSGEYLGDGSKIWSDGILFVHYDGKEGILNLGNVKEV
jgi:hypothetical protein